MPFNCEGNCCMISLALFSSAVRLVCCAEIIALLLRDLGIQRGFNVAVGTGGQRQMPVGELVPALVSMLENVCPQLFAFWKKPTTPL